MSRLRVDQIDEAPSPSGDGVIFSVLLTPLDGIIKGQVVIGFLNPEDGKHLTIGMIVELK